MGNNIRELAMRLAEESGFSKDDAWKRHPRQSRQAGGEVAMAVYGCHVDLMPGDKPDGCVLDKNRTIDCCVAQDLDRRGLGKTDCQHWLPIAPSPEQAELSRLREALDKTKADQAEMLALVKEMREALCEIGRSEGHPAEHYRSIANRAIAKADAILKESGGEK